VVGAIKIGLDFFCRVCATGLPECELGCGSGLAYSSVRWMAMGGEFTLSYPSWVVYFVIPMCWLDT